MAIEIAQFLTGVLGTVVPRMRNEKQVVSTRVPIGKIKITTDGKR